MKRKPTRHQFHRCVRKGGSTLTNRIAFSTRAALFNLFTKQTRMESLFMDLCDSFLDYPFVLMTFFMV